MCGSAYDMTEPGYSDEAVTLDPRKVCLLSRPWIRAGLSIFLFNQLPEFSLGYTLSRRYKLDNFVGDAGKPAAGMRIMLLCLLLDAALGQTCSTEGSSYTWSETTSATTRTITTK
jgi:hypothetical protein